MFSGECGKDGRTVGELTDDLERVFRSREQSQRLYLVTFMRSGVRRGMMVWGQSVGPDVLDSYPRDAFGEKGSPTLL